ncbi:dihydrofolate reductase [Propionicicella superfundia]|uniref:dihydrofolate reductase n=1 Tax=Propionicicella superfundia TaxID=348582 RepID=UPI00042212F2|nr:dihydrofolate reductase [Propionicicella superfundia]
MTKTVTAIAAVARNDVIGVGQRIPWHLPEDWERFQAVTIGNILIMGRKTYDSIGAPLPGRTTIVVSRSRPELPAGVRVVESLDAALELAESLPGRVFVAGGAEVYRAAWPRLTDLDLTLVDQEPEGGTAFFPSVNPSEWDEIATVAREGYTFVRYRRRR